MSKMSDKWLVFLLGSILCIGLPACGGENGDDEPEPQTDAGSDAGETSETTPECTENDDCEGENMVCNDDNMCVSDGNQPGDCENNDDCEDGKVCSEAGTCVDDGSSQAQCQAVGDDCDPSSGNIGSGFVCQNMGLGNKCYQSCNPQSPSCPSGSFCNTQAQSPFCQTSQCNGPTDTESCQPYVENNSQEYPNGATCLLADQASGANVCYPAGDKEEGADCSLPSGGLTGEPLPCAQGLRCLDGTCTRICEGDSDCTGENATTCIGEGNDSAVGANTGFCAENACTPYQHGESDCPDGQACQPIASDEGQCVEEGDVELYRQCQYQECSENSDCPGDVTCGSNGTCDFGTQCADGARCIAVAAGQGRCLPSCDPTSNEPNSTCPTPEQAGNPDGQQGLCFDLSQSSPDVSSSPTSGVCFERCGGLDSYGENNCKASSEDGNACQPALGSHVCFPSENIEAGESCDPTATITQCAEGSYCQARGDGSGVCESYCATGDIQNDTLTCGSEQSCQPNVNSGGAGYSNFGECKYNCEPSGELPDGATDSSCPENMQNCLPGNPDSDGEHPNNYCFASADVAAGESCGGELEAGSQLQQNCQAGNVCANNTYDTEISQSLLGDIIGGGALLSKSNADATCSASCDPFPQDGESDCGSGKACGLKGGNTDFGACMTKDSSVSSSSTSTECSNLGELCGDGSVCVPGSLLGAQGNICAQLCENVENGGSIGCSQGASCEPVFAGTQQNGEYLGKLGLCFSQQ